MLITWKEDRVEHSMTLAPNNEAIEIIPSEREGTGKKSFAIVWIKNEMSGTACVVSGREELKAVGYMQNGAKIRKSTHRIS